MLGVGAAASVDGSTVAASSGFDWADAGIGAGATAVVLMLLGGAALVAIPKRQHGRAIA